MAANPAHENPIALDALNTGGETVAGDGGTEVIVGSKGGHEVRFAFDPPFPELGKPAEVGASDGAWSIAIDGAATIAGAWHVRPGDGEV